MESIHKLGDLIEEVSKLFNSIDIPNQINSLIGENKKLKEDMKELIETHQNKCDELMQIKNKYDKDIGVKNKEIKDQKEELTRLTKISLIQQYDKQLKDKNEYIKIIESQLERYRNALKPQSPKIEQPKQPIVKLVVSDTITQSSINNEKTSVEPEVNLQIQVDKNTSSIDNVEVTHKKKKGKKNEPTKQEYEMLKTNEPAKQEPDKQEPDKQEPDKQEPDKQEPDKQEPEQEPDKQEPVDEPDKQEQSERKIRKKKQKQTEEKEDLDGKNLENDIQESINKSTKSKKTLELEDFNPDIFEDVNGYELIVYKKGYYLRDLETNELYDIKNNGPNQVVGLINSKGRVKFN
jgi:hypothetical protein